MTGQFIDLAGRVAVVTGGGTGMGAATALLFARCGADVAICGRRPEPLAETAVRIEGETGRRCLALPTDVRDEAQVEALIAAVVERLGRIDILVNNAGGSTLARLDELTTKMWDRSFSLNVDAAFHATRAAGRHFLAQKSGAIVNISSMAGINGLKKGAHYAAAKAALQMLTRVAAAEWGPHGVRVNCVAPGLIASELALEGWKTNGVDPDKVSQAIPLRRVGTPEDIANAVAFLASDAASYISGEVLAVAGGPAMSGND
ncbi:SDR family NAD(P)-dependent oxidoreductase [Novosphingobium bradum]|uniref:SDR family NAD(P)-dependent oxidoreductase n=1 Tax=Novosphingobium bradum TaxID=1737444 RepID=A0ABV7IPP3_9SPHN